MWPAGRYPISLWPLTGFKIDSPDLYKTAFQNFVFQQIRSLWSHRTLLEPDAEIGANKLIAFWNDLVLVLL
jgi:hypothetical protein